MPGPERSYINRVHYQLSGNVFKECLTGMMGSNGTPDYYYEGPNNKTLRIEYKAVPGSIPTQLDMSDSKQKYAPSPLQRRWLNRAEKNKVPVAVVLGSKTNGIIFTRGAWNYVWLAASFPPTDPKRVAEFIEHIVLKGRSIDNWHAK